MGIKTGVIVVGDKELRAKLLVMGKEADFEIGKALFDEANEIMAQSKAGFVPVKSGALRASGHVQLPRPGPLILFGYGGPAVPYALIQHEAHYQHPGGGQRKYLEIPVVAAIPGMPDRLAKDLKKWVARHAVR